MLRDNTTFFLPGVAPIAKAGSANAAHVDFCYCHVPSLLS
jgi:hypothetical protein